ncbi:hypothetical protein H6802_00710 [Candidatus Nomurabacteria bacterium]|nr:hypothetical protein [Candidatus Nomurabacteria bacterium]MCB9827752.1 hypothetical protein [Candidatus Nomurabacteria bacterium]
MKISEAQLTSFKALYKQHFGEELSREDALEKALKLVRMMQLVYKPMTKEQYQQVIKRQQQIFNL